jgi:hypothetical protein
MDKGENIINRSTQGSKTTALKRMLTVELWEIT